MPEYEMIFFLIKRKNRINFVIGNVCIIYIAIIYFDLKQFQNKYVQVEIIKWNGIVEMQILYCSTRHTIHEKIRKVAKLSDY